MKRWHLTLGLIGSALVAAVLAPRLVALTLDKPVERTLLPQPTAPTVAAPPVVPDPPAAPVGNLVVSAGLDRTAILEHTDSERFVAITVHAPLGEGELARRPVDLSVVLDASGSMSARGKIDYAKRAAKHLATSMTPSDTYSLVIFNDDATTIVPATTVQDPAVLHRAIDQIYEGGGTNLYAGMDRGASEVARTLNGSAVGRVIVLSDGNANVGVTDAGSLSRYAAGLAAKGISVSAVGLGLDYNEDLLADLADLGGGTYDFVDDPRELEAVFADELVRSASVVARDTSLKLELPEGVQLVEVIGWDARPADGGHAIWMGDLYAGETRKIIARVRVDGTEAGELTVATVRTEYHDLIDDVRAEGRSVASAHVTADAEAVRGSVDRDRAIQANRALGHWYLDMSTRAYERGELTESKRLLTEGSRVLESASASYAAPELQKEAHELQSMGVFFDAHDASSSSGKRAIKSGKERFRAAAR